MPAYNADDLMPAYNADDLIPAYNAEDLMPAYNADDLIPAYNADDSMPAYNADDLMPAYNADDLMPAYNSFRNPSHATRGRSDCEVLGVAKFRGLGRARAFEFSWVAKFRGLGRARAFEFSWVTDRRPSGSSSNLCLHTCLFYTHVCPIHMSVPLPFELSHDRCDYRTPPQTSQTRSVARRPC